MSELKNIVDYINTVLKSGSFKGKPFQKGSFNGVAELVKKTDSDEKKRYTIPIVSNEKGDGGNEVIINDKFPFQLYHRCTDVDVEEAENEDTFGDGEEKKVIFEMVLIIFADRFVTEIDVEDYITALMLDFPRTIKAILVNGSQFLKCEIDFTDTNKNTQEVLTQEYGRDDLDIRQSYIGLSFGYQIELTYRKGCFTLC